MVRRASVLVMRATAADPRPYLARVVGASAGRPLRTHAGASVMASSTRCTPGRIFDPAGRRGARLLPRRAAALVPRRRARSLSAGQIASLETGVVVHRHAGQQRNLLATQPRHPTVATEHRQPGLLRRDLGSARGEKLTDLGLAVHDVDATKAMAVVGGPAVTPQLDCGASTVQAAHLRRRVLNAGEISAADDFRAQPNQRARAVDGPR